MIVDPQEFAEITGGLLESADIGSRTDALSPDELQIIKHINSIKNYVRVSEISGEKTSPSSQTRMAPLNLGVYFYGIEGIPFAAEYNAQ